MKTFMDPTLWKWLSIAATAVFLFFLLRYVRGKSNRNLNDKQRKNRLNITLVFLAATLAAWCIFGLTTAQALGTKDPPPEPVCTCTDKCTADTFNADCEVCGAEGADLTKCIGKVPEPTEEPPEEEEFMDLIHLTEDDIQRFLAKHPDRKLVTRSLGGDYRTARINAVVLYADSHNGIKFTEPVNYPIETWFPEFEQLMNADLSLEERLTLNEKFIDALMQEGIVNPPFGLMLFDGMKEIPYIYGVPEHKAVIDRAIELVDQMYKGAYTKPADGTDAADCPLAGIPTLPDGYEGVDYFVVNKTVGVNSGIEVRDEWAEMMAWADAALRAYTLRLEGDMVVARTASISWTNQDIESSLVRMVKDTEKDTGDAVMLQAIAKSGNERSLIGFNRDDSRLEIFIPGTPDKPKEEPPKKTETPPPTNKPTNPVKPTTVTYDVYRVGKLSDGSPLYEREWVASPAVNKSTTVKGWSPEGYNLIGVNVSNVGDVEVKNSVSVNSTKKDTIVVTFTYQQKAVRTTTYPLYGEWGYYEGNEWKILKSKAELGRYAEGAPYEYTNEYKFDGFKVKRGSTYVSGKMPKGEHTVYFEYEQATYKLYGEYGYYDSNNRWHELQDAKFLGTYKYEEHFSHTAPATLKSGNVTYKVTNSPISGNMPARDHTIQFVYKAEQASKHNLYGRYGYYSGGRWVDLGSSSGELLGTYATGEYYKHYPKSFNNYSPVDPYIDGNMPNNDYTIWFEYVRGKDGQGVKNPLEDPVHTGDADIGGGENLPSDGTGDKQDTKVPETDYPGSAEDNPVINTPSKDPVKADEGDETHEGMSSGTGGQDHPVVDPDGGYTDNGDPGSTKPIEKDENTSGTVTSTNPGHGGTPTGSNNTGGNSGNSNPPASVGDTVKPEDTTPVGGTVDAGW